MSDVLIATHVALLPGKAGEGGKGGGKGEGADVLLLDPPLVEVGGYAPSVQVGVGCVSGRVSFVLSAGKLSVPSLEAALTMATAACKAIQKEVNEEMRRYSEVILHSRGRVSA